MLDLFDLFDVIDLFDLHDMLDLSTWYILLKSGVEQARRVSNVAS